MKTRVCAGKRQVKSFRCIRSGPLRGTQFLSATRPRASKSGVRPQAARYVRVSGTQLLTACTDARCDRMARLRRNRHGQEAIPGPSGESSARGSSLFMTAPHAISGSGRSQKRVHLRLWPSDFPHTHHNLLDLRMQSPEHVPTHRDSSNQNTLQSQGCNVTILGSLSHGSPKRPLNHPQIEQRNAWRHATVCRISRTRMCR